jgi:hypothetical protein
MRICGVTLCIDNGYMLHMIAWVRYASVEQLYFFCSSHQLHRKVILGKLTGLVMGIGNGENGERACMGGNFKRVSVCSEESLFVCGRAYTPVETLTLGTLRGSLRDKGIIRSTRADPPLCFCPRSSGLIIAAQRQETPRLGS